mgnify:CR=1 FL=1
MVSHIRREERGWATYGARVVVVLQILKGFGKLVPELQGTLADVHGS